MIPESFIQDLLARVDIVDLIESYLPLKKAGANYAACCPFHNEKSPSFTVSPTKQFYHCFGCGAHGTAISFLMEYAGLGFVEAVQELANRMGMVVPEESRNPLAPGESRPTASSSQIRSLGEVMVRAAQYYKNQLRQSPRAIEYLKKRGLTGEVAARFGIGYAPDGWQNLVAVFEQYNAPELLSAGLVIENEQGRRYDRFRDRVMFPIINQKGEVIGFGGRILDQGEPKYLNSPETPLFEKGREVFGLPQARQALRDTNTAIVVEGYMDVVALAQHGIGNAVATLGTATTSTHVKKLLRQVDRIVFCFDGDNAGRKAAWRALENALDALADNKHLGFVFLPDADDPDSFVREHGKEAFAQKVAQATPLSDFLIQELVSHCDIASAEGRSQLIHEAKPLLKRITTPVLRLQLVKRLVEMTGFAQAEVERLCELRPIAKAAPARAPRQAPSMTRVLLRCLLQRPELALRLPDTAGRDESSPEWLALHAITQCVRDHHHAHATIPSYPVLRESLRGSPAAMLLEQMAGNSIEMPAIDLVELEQEFNAILHKLDASQQKRAFDALQAKARSFGVAGLSASEKTYYLSLLADKSKGRST